MCIRDRHGNAGIIQRFGKIAFQAGFAVAGQLVQHIAVLPREMCIRDRFEAVKANAMDADALVMAAAVADYRPAQVAQDKIKKHDGELSIELERYQWAAAPVCTRRAAAALPSPRGSTAVPGKTPTPA